MRTRKRRIKIKARPLCGRLRGVARAAAARAEQEGQDPVLAKHAEVIRKLGKRVVKDVIEIGRRLTEAKELVGHGNWAAWLRTEFDWSEGTALNFMRVFEFAAHYKSKNFTDLSIADLNIAPSALYSLARPSTSDEVRDEMVERAWAGEAITHSTVQEALAKHVAADEAPEEARTVSVRIIRSPPKRVNAVITYAADETTDAVQEAPPPKGTESDDNKEIKEDTEPQTEARNDEPRPAGASEFTEDDAEAAWVRGLYYRAHRAIGDAQRHTDWSKYTIDLGAVEMVKQAAEAWRELADYLEQRVEQSVH